MAIKRLSKFYGIKLYAGWMKNMSKRRRGTNQMRKYFMKIVLPLAANEFIQ